MPTTDELLAQMEAEVLSTSSDDVFVIDVNSRTVSIPESIEVLGVEHDDAVHRLNFQMPKMYGEFDLSEFDVRINYVNAAGTADYYDVQDKEVSGDNITFSWLVGRTAFEKMGDVEFNICLRKTDGDGVVIKEFNTTIAILPPVLEGLETTELIVQQNPDIIESILQRLGVLEESGGSGGTKDYSDLENKPQLNGLTLEGNKSLDDIGAQPKGNYLTTESDPTVPSWAKNPTKPSYTATEVGADASGTAVAKVSEHNVAGDAHNDIRLLIQGLTTRLNTLADSDDDTLDQMSEIVAYIKSNKSLIDGITTGKVNVTDIIDNLTTNVANKPLSAAQGVALKALIDGITIPETLPNPQKLKFTGAVTAEYDGSTEQTVNIPESTGGGSAEKWELIVDEVVPEDASLVTYTEDIDGNEFSLRKALIYVYYKPSENIEETNTCHFTFDKSDLLKPTSKIDAGYPPTNVQNGKIVMALIEIGYDDIIIIDTRRSFNSTSVVDQVVHSTDYNDIAYNQSIKVNPVIDCIDIRSYSTFIGAGTEIKMWGIRK